MTVDSLGVSKYRKMAEFRLMVVGELLANPPLPGDLNKAIRRISRKTWQEPFTSRPRRFAFSTIERWYYLAKNSQNPVDDLLKKPRSDKGSMLFDRMPLARELEDLYKNNPSWSKQLLYDNLQVIADKNPEYGIMPSYNSLARWMRERGMYKQKRRGLSDNSGKQRKIFESRETRSFEALHPGSLWHLDFHHAKREVLNRDGFWFKPALLAIMDDRSRLICHMQWYEKENTDSLVHCYKQAMQKRGMPFELLTDNGSAMTSGEFTEGLKRLSCKHQTTLPYCPEQNGKQERFFGTLEGRLMKMLENKASLTLPELNKATIAWMEYDYNHKPHKELYNKKPIEVFLKEKNIHRCCVSSDLLDLAFCKQRVRKPRSYDATVTIKGRRFDIPWQYRHIRKIVIRYQDWDLTKAFLMDENGENLLAKLVPTNRQAASDGRRKTTIPPLSHQGSLEKKDEMSPLLEDMIANYAATGLPPAYIEKIQ